MSLNKDDKISKSTLKRILSYLILIVGALKLTWFGAMMLFLLMEERTTIPDIGLMMTMLVLGITEIIFAWVFLKWEEWQTPKI